MQILKLGPGQGWDFGVAALQDCALQVELLGQRAGPGWLWWMSRVLGLLGSSCCPAGRAAALLISRDPQSEIWISPPRAPGLTLDLLLNLLGRAVGYFPTCRAQPLDSRSERGNISPVFDWLHHLKDHKLWICPFFFLNIYLQFRSIFSRNTILLTN